MTSASSKTSIALAFSLAQRSDVRCIGLTSPRNREFVEKLGYYDEVVLYDDVGSLPDDAPAIFVDMAGNAAVRSAAHHRFGDGLVHSCSVGATHWDQGAGGGDDLIGLEVIVDMRHALTVQPKHKGAHRTDREIDLRNRYLAEK